MKTKIKLLQNVCSQLLRRAFRLLRGNKYTKKQQNQLWSEHYYKQIIQN